jgi:hypothetical protein
MDSIQITKETNPTKIPRIKKITKDESDFQVSPI